MLILIQALSYMKISFIPPLLKDIQPLVKSVSGCYFANFKADTVDRSLVCVPLSETGFGQRLSAEAPAEIRHKLHLLAIGTNTCI